jgi:nitrate reductase gamma subunit
MSTLVYVIAYLGILVFVGAVIAKAAAYKRKPLHLRWELYPVAHEPGRADYGGSYLEDVGWWQKPRHSSLVGELKVMVPEILFLKAVWEFNRPLWYLTYPFHLGLYITAAFVALLLASAIGQVAGVQLPFGQALAILGPAGFGLTILGAVGLFWRRLTSAEMRNYSSVGHFFNLAWFVVAMGVAAVAWWTVDPTFTNLVGFLTNAMRLRFEPIAEPLVAVELLLAFTLLAYIPLTHMAHFFMKYFMYHDIRWGDDPNVNNPARSAQIAAVLQYPVTWSAPHIAGHGKTTWAEVATFNPAAAAASKKE